jgi:Tol biopolymer transport system component
MARGSHFAFGVRGSIVSESSIWTMIRDKVTAGSDNFPAWSPNGDLIAFTRFSEDDYDIYTIRPDGTGLKRLTTTPGKDAHEIWSPDGKQILFSSARLGFKDEAPLSDDILNPMANSL